ncbi:bifunctional 5,10-methylenetetrahydrofolate dehydrogenase/5,10-methenyltetrahydrofolate cyclohydrolase [soil metagenome]
MEADSPGDSRILDGRRLAEQIYAETASDLSEFGTASGELPGVAIVMVGDDRASAVYARQIMRAAERIGSSGRLVELAGDASLEQVRAVVEQLNRDSSVAGVIFQLPLPRHLAIRTVASDLDPLKDIDGVSSLSAGLVSQGEAGFAPSCAEAAVLILKRYGIPIAGRPAVVVGRSNVVGRPAQLLLIREHATVTVCHRQTRDLGDELRRAEIVIVAAGSPGLVKGDAIRPGAVVIDCGINVLEDGSLAGDVEMASVSRVASALTAVPGGVGPVTNAVLMRHLGRAIRAQRSRTGVGGLIARPAS